MPEPTPSRPRLVSVGGDTGAEPPAPPEAKRPGSSGVSRGLFLLLAALALLTGIGLYIQGEKVRTLSRENAALTGELFTARSALEAYAGRFSEVRESVAGLQARLAELGDLVSEDPVTGAPAAPRAEAAPAPETEPEAAPAPAAEPTPAPAI